MRLLKAFLASTVFAASFAGTAFAKDFNGPFVGVQTGWNSDKAGSFETPLGPVSTDDDHEAFTGGVFAGYDYRLNERAVIGLEGSFDFASDDKLHGTSSASAFTLDPQYSFDLTARAGYLVTPETLVYVRSGYTNARIKTTITDSVGAHSETGNQDGWLVGGGVEHQLMDHVSARMEYRYSDLGEGAGTYDRHRVLAGISYRF